MELSAGRDGIEKKMDPGDFYVGDIYGEEPGKFETMPLCTHEAGRELKNDGVLCEVIAPVIIQNFTTIKMGEAERFRTYVTEIGKSVNILTACRCLDPPNLRGALCAV